MAERASLRTLERTSVRLDAATRIRWLTPALIELHRGALYIDTAEGARPLEIQTPYGSATDIGTQFEVRVEPGAFRVRVRSGAVAIERGAERYFANQGTEMTISSRGAETRPVSVTGEEWAWTATIAPTIAFDGARLRDYLTAVAHENGLTLRYADAATRGVADRAVLRGSVEGLSVRDAVDVAIRAAGLTYTLEGGLLAVRARSDVEWPR
jgi:ferric-dicitrate binding protein FerR (iron transport regulator)